MELFLYISLAFCGIILFLWLLNFPKSLRYKQVWSPIAAITYSVIVVVLYLKIHPLIESLSNSITKLLQNLITLPVYQGISDFPLIFNFSILLIFLIIKLSCVASTYLGMAFMWLKIKILRRQKAEVHSRQSRIDKISFAYNQDEYNKELFWLRKEYVFPGILASYLAWFSFILLAGSIFVYFVYPLSFFTPKLPVLSLLIFLEIAWYLGGLRPFDKIGRIAGDDVATERIGDYRPLWEKYQRVWPAHIMAANIIETFLTNKKDEEVKYIVSNDTNGENQEMLLTWKNLKKEGFELSSKHYKLFNNIWKGKDVIIESSVCSNIAPVLFAAIHKIMTDGYRALIVVDHRNIESQDNLATIINWVNEKLSGKTEIWKVMSFREHKRQRVTPDVIVASSEELYNADTTGDLWFNQLKTILFLNVTSIYQNPIFSNALMKRLKEPDRKDSNLQVIIVSDYRQSIEPAMRKNMLINPIEFRFTQDLSGELYVIVWKLENIEWFQQKIMSGDIGRFISAESALSVLAWEEGIEPITIVGQENIPIYEYIEELQQYKESLLGDIKSDNLSEDARDFIRYPLISWLIPDQKRAFILSRDSEYNITSSFNKWLPYAHESMFLHIISPPYLLRDYFTDNIEYFFESPFFPLTPRIMEDKLTIACSIVEKLLFSEVSEKNINREIGVLNKDVMNIENALHGIIKDALNVDIIRSNYLTTKYEYIFNEENNTFEEIKRYSLLPNIKDEANVSWMKTFEIIDTGDNILGTILSDHLQQTYLEGQIHSFSGKSFLVEHIDDKTSCLKVKHVTPIDCMTYRPKIEITLGAGEKQGGRSHVEERYVKKEEISGGELTLKLCEAGFKITTLGYFIFNSREGIIFHDKQNRFFRLNNILERHYPLGRFLQVEINNDLIRSNRQIIAYTLSVLLQEILPTLFPESYRFIHAVSPIHQHFEGKIKDLEYFPTLRNSADPNVVLYLFEDSHTNSGLIQCIYDEWFHIIKLLDDYLAWLLNEEPRLTTPWTKPAIDKTHFLKYGREDISEHLDLQAVRTILNSLLNGQNTLTQDRRKFNSDEKRATDIKMSSDIRQCDFCGAELSSVEYEKLTDGRERCKTCRNSAVNTVKELDNVYQEARTYFNQNIKVKLKLNILIEFTSAQRIQEVSRKDYIPTSNFDPRAVGTAIKEGGDYKIFIENGAPYHMTLATAIHELTHIWQFDNLNFEKMKADHGKMMIEGHAMWAELDCLEKYNLAPNYRKRESSRQDDYGKGYRMILELQKQYAMENPFDILLRLYPKN